MGAVMNLTGTDMAEMLTQQNLAGHADRCAQIAEDLVWLNRLDNALNCVEPIRAERKE
jgi:hypothetical protein